MWYEAKPKGFLNINNNRIVYLKISNYDLPYSKRSPHTAYLIPHTCMMKYAGMATQFLVSIGLAVFIGFKADKWLHISFPVLIWALPLLVIIFTIYKLIKETSSKR